MTYDALWAALHDAGIEVQSAPSQEQSGVNAGSLRVTRASALTPDLRDALKAHKTAILAELSLPLVQHVLLVFGGVEVDANAKPLRRQPLLNRRLDLQL